MSGFVNRLPYLTKLLHRLVGIGYNHVPHNWEYANLAARTAATNFTIKDLRKLALQLDDNTLWLLTAVSPATWLQVGTGAAGGGGGGALVPPQTFSVNRNAVNQTAIPNATGTKVLFTTKVKDDNSTFDVSTSRHTPKVAGDYLYTAALQTTAATGLILALLYKNGAELVNTFANSGTSTAGAHISAIVPMNGTTDYIELFVYQSAGAARDINGDIKATWFSGTLLALQAPFPSINPQTGIAYTLALTDGGNGVDMANAAANTVTVPPNSAVAFPVGTSLLITQGAAGQTTIAAGAGVTIKTSETLKLRKQEAVASLLKVGADTWRLFGDLEGLP